jgi:hypothetical protein
MKKFIIKWNAGYGENYIEIEAENEEKAIERAYEEWKEDVECNADYGVVGEATDELREDYL